MIIGHKGDVEKESLAARGGENAEMQWMLGEKEGVPHFYMRYVTVGKGGGMPLHNHEWIHQMYFIKGSAVVLTKDGEETPVEPGSFVYMPSNKIHGLRNTGDEDLEFICAINKT